MDEWNRLYDQYVSVGTKHCQCAIDEGRHQRQMHFVLVLLSSLVSVFKCISTDKHEMNSAD